MLKKLSQLQRINFPFYYQSLRVPRVAWRTFLEVKIRLWARAESLQCDTCWWWCGSWMHCSMANIVSKASGNISRNWKIVLFWPFSAEQCAKMTFLGIINEKSKSSRRLGASVHISSAIMTSVRWRNWRTLTFIPYNVQQLSVFFFHETNSIKREGFVWHAQSINFWCVLQASTLCYDNRLNRIMQCKQFSI